MRTFIQATGTITTDNEIKLWNAKNCYKLNNDKLKENKADYVYFVGCHTSNTNDDNQQPDNRFATCLAYNNG